MFSTNVEQSTYLATTSIAFASLTELVSLVCGGTWRNWQYVSYALWWVALLLALAAATTTYWLLVRDEQVAIENLSPTLMYPVTGILATASAGCVVIEYTPISVRLAMPVLVVSYLLAGAGEFSLLRTELTLQASSLPSSRSPPTSCVSCTTRPRPRKRSAPSSSPSPR